MSLPARQSIEAVVALPRAFERINEIVHQRTRLGLLCVLSQVDERDFNGLRRDLNLSDGNLARHITVLRAARMVEADQRITDGNRRRTYLRLTDLGRDALRTELMTMSGIITTHLNGIPTKAGVHAVPNP